MMPVAFVLAILGMGLIALVVRGQSQMHESTRNRLSLKKSARGLSIHDGHDEEEPEPSKAQILIPKRVIKKASDFYSNTDPDDSARIRLKLIRAGFMDPGAVGLYFLLRMVAGISLLLIAIPALMIFAPYVPLSKQLMVAGIGGMLGYFSPNIILNNIIKRRTQEYRAGFPDFMDLMIVCADAGMSMEAAIERVSREITLQYPALSQNLAIITIELRAGRQLSDALKSLSDRLGLDEVRSFATLLQQSKELGTSLSDTLRVFSEEMRHKRMSKAEEKAHALPAKMTVPVTMFILPVIMLIATIPAIVNMSSP
jgi:tight adherence protein C